MNKSRERKISSSFHDCCVHRVVTLRELNCHHDSPVKNGDQQRQAMHSVLAHIHVIIGPIVPRNLPVIISLFPACTTVLDTCSCNATLPVDPWSAKQYSSR